MNMHAMDEVKPLENAPLDNIKPIDEKRPDKIGRIFNIAGFSSTFISLFALPILFAPAAIALGAICMFKGDHKISNYVVIAAVCAALIGATTMLYFPYNGVFTPTGTVIFGAK